MCEYPSVGAFDGRDAPTGKLWLVGTPIGNLADASPRSAEVLAAVDLVAAEDTRRSATLLRHLGVRAKVVSFFEGNEDERGAELLGRLRGGETVAVVSDAGMPGVSDPGYRLVRACVEDGIEVGVVPGPSSVLAALVVSGLPTDRFAFEGFLPRRSTEREARLADIADDPRTLVFFESPRRTVSTLEAIAVTFGDRRVALCRELTKLHEEILRGSASEVAAAITDRGGDLKGEVVLVVEGARASAASAAVDLRSLAAEARALASSGLRKRDAAARVARSHGASTNDVYRAMLED
jgi:16S rRNA (cytidine1402-2'-O)-methyltransferase